MKAQRFVMAVLVLGCQGPEPKASAPGIVNNAALCPDCSIEFQELAVLGSPSDPASISEEIGGIACGVGRLSSGEFVVSLPAGGGELFVYDQSGAVTRRLGRPGRGPGEFGRNTAVAVLQGDTILAVDLARRRWTVFAGSDSVIYTSPTLGPIISFGPSRDGNIVLNERAPGLVVERPVGQPYPPDSDPRHIFTVRTKDGRVVSRDSLPPAPAEWGGQWFVSPSAKGVWTGPADRLEVILWSIDGRALQQLTWDVDWFPPGIKMDPGFPLTAPPSPIFLHAAEDQQDRLWIYVAIPDPNFKPLTDTRAAYEMTTETIARYFDTYVEVVDLKRQQVITRATYETILRPVCGDQAVYAPFYTEEGDTRLRVLMPMVRE